MTDKATAITSRIKDGVALAAKYGGTPGKVVAGGALAGAGIYYGTKAAFGQTPGEMISKQNMPSPLDVLQTGSSMAAELALVASAQAAREARKSVTVKEIKATLAKAKIEGRSKITRKADMLKALDKAGIQKVGRQTIGKAYGTAYPFMLAGASMMTASNTYMTARNAGRSKVEAAGAAAVAATPTALAIAAPSAIGRVAPKVALGLVKYSIPLALASASIAAMRAGYKAYKDGKSAGEVSWRAAMGAIDTVTLYNATPAYERWLERSANKAPGAPSQPQIPLPNPSLPNPSANTTTAAGADNTAVRLAQAAGQINDAGLPASGRAPTITDPAFLRQEGDQRMGPRERRATQTMSDAATTLDGVRLQRERIRTGQAQPKVTKAPTGGSGSVGRQSSLDAGQKQAFAEANTHFAASHMDNPAQPQEGTGPTGVGWGDPRRQYLAQEARGVKNKTSWAKA